MKIHIGMSFIIRTRSIAINLTFKCVIERDQQRLIKIGDYSKNKWLMSFSCLLLILFYYLVECVFTSFCSVFDFLFFFNIKRYHYGLWLVTNGIRLCLIASVRTTCIFSKINLTTECCSAYLVYDESTTYTNYWNIIDLPSQNSKTEGQRRM